MRGIFKRGSGRDLERELRAARPEPRAEFLASVAARVHEATPAPRTSVFRVAFAGALTLVMLVALAAVGGVSYAANALTSATSKLERIFEPTGPIEATKITAGQDQYRPGYGWGDPNHNHTGPPGLRRTGGPLAPPLRARVHPQDNRFMRVPAQINVSEQAQLTISIIGPRGQKLLISQRRSAIGQGVTGPSTKNVMYTVLIPRNGFPINVAIPRNLLRPGFQYYIRVTAKDPHGEVSVLRIPFRA